MKLINPITLIPARFLRLAAAIIFWISYPWSKKDRRLIAENIQRVYGLPPHSAFSREFVYQNLTMQMQIILDTLRFLSDPSALTIEGLDEAKAFFSSKNCEQGSVIITAHLGSWELAGHFAASCLSKDFHVLAKPTKSKYANLFLTRIRHHLGMKVLWTDSKSLLRDMLKLSGLGHHIGFVMDQRPGQRQGGHPSVFLGIPETNIVPGPVLMAIRKNMPVFSIYLIRVGVLRYRLVVNEVLRSGHQLVDEALVAQRMADDMSKVIMLYPEQWSWNYRRWKNKV